MFLKERMKKGMLHLMGHEISRGFLVLGWRRLGLLLLVCGKVDSVERLYDVFDVGYELSYS